MSPHSSTPGKAELEILEVLWKHGPSTARVISDALAKTGSARADTTVHTMLLRLKQKKLVSSRRTKHGLIFQPRLDKQQLAERSVKEVLDKLGEVTAIPVVKALIDRRELSDDEIQELKSLVDQLPTSPPPQKARRKSSSRKAGSSTHAKKRGSGK